MNRHSGFSLVEMLVVIITLPVVLLVTNQLFRIFALEMPRGHRIVEEQTTVLHLLQQLRTDIDDAQHLHVDESTAERKLTIQTPDNPLAYHIQAQGVTRTPGTIDTNSEYWRLPHAQVYWSVIQPQPGTFALRVDSSIQDTRRGHSRSRLANTHLFFIPAPNPKEVQP